MFFVVPEQQEGFAWSSCWRKKGSLSPPSAADSKGQNLGSAVSLVSCYMDDKGIGTMRVELRNETLFWGGTPVPAVLFKVVSVATAGCRKVDE